MRITVDLLKRYNACKQSIEFMQANYPDGAEAIEIMQRKDIPLHFLHFGRQYLDLNDEEIQLYKQICKIDDNSRHIWYSNDVNNSIGLMHAHHVSNSSFVRDSFQINNSKHIYNSNNISNCDDIAHSTNIKDSNKILESHDIAESNDVARSNFISWSSAILNSFLLEDCSFIYKSDNLKDCHFCGFIKNSKHCLFCTELKDKEYYIFNHEVNPTVYEKYREELLLQLQAETPCMINVFSTKYTAEERFELSARFDNVFNGLSEAFYGWIGTLPNYSDEVFINLFFKNRE